MVASSFPKARRFARRPVLFASIQIGNEAQGLILNGSEGGICVQITAGTVVPGLVDLRFQSAGTAHPAGWVECRGQIVWSSDDRTVAGIEFVDPTPETNREIGNWLSFGESLRELRREWPADQASQSHWADDISEREASSFALPVGALPPNVSPIENAKQENEPKQLRPRLAAFGQNYEDAMPRSRILQLVAIALVVLIGAVILMKLHRPGWGFRSLVSKTARSNQSRETDQPTAAPATNTGIISAQTVEPPLANSLTASTAPLSAPAPYGETSPVAIVSANLGLMLQAGAMTEEQNAKEMAQSLQQKHYPAFVYKKDGDRFYRVFIGPYASDQSLRQAQTALRSLNIPTIKKKSAT
jgi:cell division septation protein DedD